MNREELIRQLEEINVCVSAEQMEQIEVFCQFLLTENRKYNLTAIKVYEDILLKHVYDSLTISKVVDMMECNNMLDIGSGGGFPGIILQIVYPHLEVTVLDSNSKKTKFLSMAKHLLKLEKLRVVNERAELFAHEERNAFDLVTARAVASLNVLIELAVPLIKPNGVFVAMKGNIADELSLAKDTCEFLNCYIDSTFEFLLPIENSKRTLVVVKKQGKTPVVYPRSYDRILKKPLKSKQK